MGTGPLTAGHADRIAGQFKPAHLVPRRPVNENTRSQQTGNPDAKVWVNTSSDVYHCPGTRWYGNTKQGEFMSQRKAQDTGKRPAYGKVCQ